MLRNFTVIEGNIGSGKTTLCKMLSKEFKTNLILEEFEENPFLSDFLKDQKINPLGVELHFLIDRFEQLRKSTLSNVTTIADYFIEKSLVFSTNNLSNIEKQLFDRYYHVLFESITKPSVLIYLSVKSDRLIQNIKKRGRKIEQDLTASYLESIHDSYINYLEAKVDETIVIIEVSEIDFVNNPNDYEKLKSIILQDHAKGITKITL